MRFGSITYFGDRAVQIDLTRAECDSLFSILSSLQAEDHGYNKILMQKIPDVMSGRTLVIKCSEEESDFNTSISEWKWSINKDDLPDVIAKFASMLQYQSPSHQYFDANDAYRTIVIVACDEI